MENKILGQFRTVYLGKLTIYQDKVELTSLIKSRVILINKIADISYSKLSGKFVIEIIGGGKIKVYFWGGRKISEKVTNLITSIRIDTASSMKISEDIQEKDIKAPLIQTGNSLLGIAQEFKSWSTRKKIIVFGILFIIFVGFFKITNVEQSIKQQQTQKETKPLVPVSQEPKAIEQKSERSIEQAQKELDEVMKLAKRAGLILSYEFSDKANIVYADAVWYTQNIQFKKDFLAKVAALKKEITGYHRFEVRDAYSNEKVAEVTAFSGSLEVYK